MLIERKTPPSKRHSFFALVVVGLAFGSFMSACMSRDAYNALFDTAKAAVECYITLLPHANFKRRDDNE
jgi:hypothetical protein